MSDLTEIAISFDTTGSMRYCLHTVRDNLDANIKRLLREHPRTRIAILAHGDYCDAGSTYVTKMIDFTSDVGLLTSFVNGVEDTDGGDGNECYELVLREVRTKMSWTPGSRRAYVLIGDSRPHGVDYPQNTQRIDWKEEVRLLAGMGIRGYAVQCRRSGFLMGLVAYLLIGNVDELYATLASQTQGVHLQLSDLANISDTLVAICLHRMGPAHLQAYEHEVRARPDHVTSDVDAIFATLRQHQDA